MIDEVLGRLEPNNTSGDTKILHCPQVYNLPPRHIFDQPFLMGVRGSWNYPLYKMLKEEHSNAFFADGTLRLGTLFDYAKEELHGKAIGDMREGLSSAMIIDDDGFEQHYITSAVNSYVYSTSRVFNEELLKDFRADSVIEIQSIDFFAAISRVIQDRVGASVLAPVTYHSQEEWSKIFLEKGATNIFNRRETPRISHVKSIDYRNQKEVRCIWEAKVSLDLLNNPFLSRFVPYSGSSLIDTYTEVRSSAIGSFLVPEIIKVPEATKYAKLMQI